MACKLYMDQHVPRAITAGLRMRQIDVLTAYEDGTSELTDPQLLDRATILGRVLFSQDVDLLAEARRRQAEGISFGGVIYAQQQRVSIGRCVEDLEILLAIGTMDDLSDRVTYSPL
jgi:uncharacterized protein DUF5615